MRPARIAALACVTLAAGCSSQWYAGNSKRDIARTDVIIHTQPEGATVVFDGHAQPEPSPIKIPVEYDHVETVWERQSNYGTRMLDGMNPIVAVLTFPVWAVASFFHYREDTRRHEYGGNSHVISAYIPGRDEAQETITLEGEAQVTVNLSLPLSKR